MSKVLVAVKRVIDYNARVRIKPDKASLAELLPAASDDTAAD
jgi:electron transfer flavoprotein alpha/beta subunit